MDLVTKCLKVIESCNTPEQLCSAGNYLELAIRKIKVNEALALTNFYNIKILQTIK